MPSCAQVCYSSKAWNPVFNAERGEGDGGYAVELLEGGEDFCEVLDGGPEKVDEHADRTLVLMWPDYRGLGTFGTECLERCVEAQGTAQPWSS